MAVSALGTIPAGSQISPANQRIYQQSNLIGDWKGTWTKNKQAVELNVVSSTAAPRRSSARILLPTPFILATRRPASGLEIVEMFRVSFG